MTFQMEVSIHTLFSHGTLHLYFTIMMLGLIKYSVHFSEFLFCSPMLKHFCKDGAIFG